jgi:hypothetical protein
MALDEFMEEKLYCEEGSPAAYQEESGKGFAIHIDNGEGTEEIPLVFISENEVGFSFKAASTIDVIIARSAI